MDDFLKEMLDDLINGKCFMVNVNPEEFDLAMNYLKNSGITEDRIESDSDSPVDIYISLK